MAAENTTEEMLNVTDIPPTHDLAEYITIGYQTLFLVIGVPLNIQALCSVISGMSRHTNVPRLLLLKLNLVLSDLMILLIYTVSEICWMATFTWFGGVFLCKLVKFFHLCSFVAHSNIIVSIAVDRVLTMRSIRTFKNNSSVKQRRTRVMLIASWVAAGLVSVPQLFVWTVDTPYPGWTQCATVWDFDEFFQGTERPNFWENCYSLAHLLVIFYFPAGLLTVAYIFAFLRLRECQNERETKGFRLQRIRSDNDFSVADPLLNGDTSPRRNTVCSSPDVTNVVSMVITRNFHKVRRGKNIWLNSSRSKALRRTILLAVAYVICFAPYNVCALWRQIAIEDWRNGNYEAIIGFLDGPIILNAVIDPILYKLDTI